MEFVPLRLVSNRSWSLVSKTLPTHRRTEVREPQTVQPQPPPPHRRRKADCEIAAVTPVRGPAAVERGPWTLVLGSGKVLIVGHM